MKPPFAKLLWNDFQNAKKLSVKLKCSDKNEIELFSFIQSTYNKGANDCLEYLRNNGMLKESAQIPE